MACYSLLLLFQGKEDTALQRLSPTGSRRVESQALKEAICFSPGSPTQPQPGFGPGVSHTASAWLAALTIPEYLPRSSSAFLRWPRMRLVSQVSTITGGRAFLRAPKKWEWKVVWGSGQRPQTAVTNLQGWREAGQQHVGPCCSHRASWAQEENRSWQ